VSAGSTRNDRLLCDSHCHLDFPELADDLEGVLDRAATAGVARLVAIGTGRAPRDLEGALAIARRHAGWIRATVGVHPHDARYADRALLESVERLAADPLVVAVGETGLDHHYDNSPRDAQRTAFVTQVAIARAVRKPLVIHTRNALEETLEVLRTEGAADVGGVIHCFSEDAAFAARALDLGFIASFSGLVTFPRGTEAIRDAARRQPADAILVETDAPYLAPVPHRGRRNEPAFVAHTARAVAALRGVAPEDLFRITTDNACRLFALPPC